MMLGEIETRPYRGRRRPMTAEQWATLEECIGQSTTGHLKALVTALRMMPTEAAALGLGEKSDLANIVEALQVITDAEMMVLRIQDHAVMETMEEAVDFALANGAITGNERPLA